MDLATHSGKLERWLGTAEIERMSAAMKDWYGPPIAVGNVPGAVYACRGGDFRGRITAGQMAPLIDYYEQRLKRIIRRASRRQLSSLNAGFTSVSDLISEATTGGKARHFMWQKTGIAGVVGGSVSHWGLGTVPSAGANAANAPGGEAPTSATVGAVPFANPTGGDTQHFVTGRVVSTIGPLTPLLYDRIFQVNKTMNSNATESVTGVPTRYQSSTRGNADFAGGNFAFPEVGGTALASGAHNWTVCKYRDQDGNDAISFPSAAGRTAAGVRTIDLAVPSWFMTLAAGDDGVMDLNQLQYDTSAIATGVINWVIGHPIAFMPVRLANEMIKEDGIMTAFNLTRIFDDAALAFLSIYHDVTTSLSLTASVDTVAG
jgi:hypothetical protein